MKFAPAIFVAGVFVGMAVPLRAQTISAATRGVDEALSVTVGEKEYRIASEVLTFKVVRAGKAIVFAVPGTSESNRDAGQGVYYTEAARIVAPNKPPEGIYASGFRLDAIDEMTTRKGRFVLLLSLTDRAGIPRAVVIAPKDGATLLWERARFAGRKGNKIVVHLYARSGPAKMGPKDKPLYTRTFDPDEAL